LVKRAAGRIIRKLKVEQDQMAVYMEQLAGWKEGDGTYDLAVSMADVVLVDSESVVVREDSRTRENIKIGALALRDGHAIAFPTETVYGLGADARNTEAVAKIYAAKNRPADNPLITHFGSLSHLQSFTALPEIYRPLVRKFWPGPLTVLLPVKPSMRISPLVTAGLDTLAVRVPSSPLARALLLESRVPIAAPSANASTRPSPTRASHVLDDLHSRIPLILNADQDVEMDRPEQCQVGLESTVVDGLSHPPTILRLGGVSLEEIQALGGEWANTVIYQKPAIAQLPSPHDEVEFKPRTPGMKYRHYSPRCPVYLYPPSSTQPSHPSTLIPSSSLKSGRKFGYLCTADWGPFVEDPGNDLQFAWLGNDVEEIARSLFRSVRDLDEWGAEAIFVEGLEEVGLGRSVMERLRKMAGGKLGGP
jgi:L-threonylcarbamoyladenylate synthase